MHVVRLPGELPTPSCVRALVPTMGALHPGHASLMALAKQSANEVVVSIFVNPTQFRPGEDFERYPRTPENDLELCEAAGVDYVYMPSAETMYPAGQSAVSVHVSSVGELWEGPIRPGHFDGVATVVSQLFLQVRPHLAIFSVKDLQQCAVIERLVSGLHFGLKVQLAPTLRESDGLAMSSRNRYLSSEDRAIAPQLNQALVAAKQELLANKTSDIGSILSNVTRLLDRRFDLQYMALVNRKSMAATSSDDPDAWVITAAKLGETRLIDNISLYNS